MKSIEAKVIEVSVVSGRFIFYPKYFHLHHLPKPQVFVTLVSYFDIIVNT
jgi:hypothetical protein